MSTRKQKKITEEKGDISSKDPAESDDTNVLCECKETVLSQIEATVAEAESPPLHRNSISKAPTLGGIGGGNFSDVTQRKEVIIENNNIFEDYPIKNTGTVESGSGGYRTGANHHETVDEHVPTKGDGTFDTHLSKPRAGKLKHLALKFASL